MDYKDINASFNQTCVYRIGNEAGFFSEINNMILAMIYCLENELYFKLYSSNSIYGHDIWLDYFVPFTEHITDSVHNLFNERPYMPRRSYSLGIDELFQIKKILSEVILTQDIWPYIRNKDLYNEDYFVNSKLISGNLILVAGELIKIIWRFNLHVSSRIANLIDKLNLRKPYVGMHIRRGNKNIEAPYQDVRAYFTKLDEVAPGNRYPVFIATDDYRMVNEAMELFPDRDIHHFSSPGDTGWFKKDFVQNFTKAEQQEGIIHLLVEVEMLRNAEIFVGTFSTNVGMFVGMARKGNKIYGVDYNHWIVW